MCKEKTSHEDNDSWIWSTQLNSSKKDTNEEEVIKEEDYHEEIRWAEKEYQAAGGIIDEMYEGMSKISMKELNTQWCVILETPISYISFAFSFLISQI